MKGLAWGPTVGIVWREELKFLCLTGFPGPTVSIGTDSAGKSWNRFFLSPLPGPPVLGMEPRASRVPGKYSSTELQPQP